MASFDCAWLPEALQARHRRVPTLHDGDSLQLAAGELPQVVSALKEAGWEVIGDDLVIRVAGGW